MAEATGAPRDTIYALSSGALPAGIAVVRVSGPDAGAALAALCGGAVPPPRQATLRTLADPATGQVIDHALVLRFVAPASATGEDVAEFHLHGGTAVVAALVGALAAMPGLRLAAAGEFTRRAFDSGRLDLTQAEGLADLIDAETDAQHRAALVQAGGALRQASERWRSVLVAALADAEAALDFAEAEEDVATGLGDHHAPLVALLAEIDAALADGARAHALRDGLTVVVSGPPNVGKSSLVNALARRDVAIVSPRAGTTRDAIEVRLNLGGVLVTLVDTAGLRDTDDEVEAAGTALARRRAASADLVLTLFTDGGPPRGGQAVRTKIDLGGGPSSALPDGTIAVSTLTGAGMAELETWLADWARIVARPAEPPLIARQRQRAACAAARADLAAALDEPDPVLRAEALHLATRALGTVTGAIGVEAVLDAIFDRFCVGK